MPDRRNCSYRVEWRDQLVDHSPMLAIELPLLTSSRGVHMLYAAAHECVPPLPGYRRTVAGPIEPDLHAPAWGEVQALNRTLALRGVRRFRGVQHSLLRIRDLGRLSPIEVRTLIFHPDERVPLAVLHAIRDADIGSPDVAYDRRRFIAGQIAERGRWLEALGARWNPIYDALIAFDLAAFAPVPQRATIDALGPWVDRIRDPRLLEPALRFRCAPLLELVASRIHCADPAFVEAIVMQAPVAGPALALNPYVDDELRSALGTLAVMRLRSLRAFNEHVPGVAEWVATFLTVRRNLLATLCAVRERNCQPSPDAMFALVHDADLDRVRSPARTPIRCRVARQALLALGFPVPRDVAESTYPEYAACLRAEMVRNPDWHVAPPASRRFRVLAQAVRDIAFPVQVPYVRYVPRDVAGPFASAALERGAILAAIPLVRTLDARAFRDCLLQLSRTGPQAVRRLCELATREQLKAITYAFMQRVVPEAETQPWRHVLSLIPAAWHDPSVRRRLIDNADVYIAVRILPGITRDEQRRVFGALRTYNPADALEVLERNIGDVQRALRPADLTEFLTHWAPEVRLRAQMLVHTIDAPSVPANGVRAVPDGGSEG